VIEDGWDGNGEILAGALKEGASHIFRRLLALARLVSPHPGPLPWGEGEAFDSSRRIRQRLELTLRFHDFSLSPREKVRVRGNRPVTDPVARRLTPSFSSGNMQPQ
jgi:hypothetical protein